MGFKHLIRCLRTWIQIVVLAAFFPAYAGSYDDFFRAIVRDDPNAVLALVARGFDPNSVDEYGQSGLGRALMVDSFQAALALARLPATDVRWRNRSGESTLMLAALKGQEAICRVLLERGAAADSEGWTPLHYAASGNSLAVARLLLARGARVDAPAPNGRTPLMLAAQHGSEELVDALLAAGADPSARDRREVTAADMATAAGREPLAARLEGLAARRRARR